MLFHGEIKEKLKTRNVLAAILPGSPCIYYGTEIAMEGSFDPDCRRCMPWDDIESGRYKERINMVSQLIHLRINEPLLKSRNFPFPG